MQNFSPLSILPYCVSLCPPHKTTSLQHQQKEPSKVNCPLGELHQDLDPSCCNLSSQRHPSSTLWPKDRTLQYSETAVTAPNIGMRRWYIHSFQLPQQHSASAVRGKTHQKTSILWEDYYFSGLSHWPLIRQKGNWTRSAFCQKSGMARTLHTHAQTVSPQKFFPPCVLSYLLLHQSNEPTTKNVIMVGKTPSKDFF